MATGIASGSRLRCCHGAGFFENSSHRGLPPEVAKELAPEVAASNLCRSGTEGSGKDSMRASASGRFIAREFAFRPFGSETTVCTQLGRLCLVFPRARVRTGSPKLAQTAFRGPCVQDEQGVPGDMRRCILRRSTMTAAPSQPRRASRAPSASNNQAQGKGFASSRNLVRARALVRPECQMVAGSRRRCSPTRMS